jgi:hypothetical protein
MTIKKIHFISGLTITIFIGLHLFNHIWSILGADKHIEMMNNLRVFYRNIFVETILLLAVLVQIISGLKLFKSNRKTAANYFDKLHIWSGMYSAVFLIIHLSGHQSICKFQGRFAKIIFILQMPRNILSLLKRFGRRVFQNRTSSSSKTLPVMHPEISVENYSVDNNAFFRTI